MNLTEMFFGTFVPPENATSRIHRIGFSNGTRYEPPKRKVFDATNPVQEKLPASAKKVYQVLKQQVNYISPVDMEKKTPWTRNHCSMIMALLFKEGLLLRHKISYKKTKMYVYKVKKPYETE